MLAQHPIVADDGHVACLRRLDATLVDAAAKRPKGLEAGDRSIPGCRPRRNAQRFRHPISGPGSAPLSAISRAVPETPSRSGVGSPPPFRAWPCSAPPSVSLGIVLVICG